MSNTFEELLYQNPDLRRSGMKAKRSDIVEIIHGTWPHLIDGHTKPGNIFIPHSFYWLPSHFEVQTFLVDTWFEKFDWIKGLFMCTDFADIMHAFIIQERYRKAKEKEISTDEYYQWALGVVWGTLFQGREMSHGINLVICDDGKIYMIEPQNDNIWEADSEKDKIHYIRI